MNTGMCMCTVTKDAGDLILGAPLGFTGDAVVVDLRFHVSYAAPYAAINLMRGPQIMCHCAWKSKPHKYGGKLWLDIGYRDACTGKWHTARRFNHGVRPNQFFDVRFECAWREGVTRVTLGIPASFVEVVRANRGSFADEWAVVIPCQSDTGDGAYATVHSCAIKAVSAHTFAVSPLLVPTPRDDDAPACAVVADPVPSSLTRVDLWTVVEPYGATTVTREALTWLVHFATGRQAAAAIKAVQGVDTPCGRLSLLPAPLPAADMLPAGPP